MGKRLGRFISNYRLNYFTPDKRNGQIVYSYKPLPFAEQAIYDAISDITISMKSTDHLKMPELVSTAYPAVMSDAETQTYKDFKSEYVMKLGKDKEITAANAAVLCGKLMQMANGAIYDESDECHLIHPASAGHGLNLQSGGSTIVWFGMTWSLELYSQTNARLWRQGQISDTVVVMNIITAGTIDEDIIEVLQRKEKTQSALIAAVKANL